MLGVSRPHLQSFARMFVQQCPKAIITAQRGAVSMCGAEAPPDLVGVRWRVL